MKRNLSNPGSMFTTPGIYMNVDDGLGGGTPEGQINPIVEIPAPITPEGQEPVQPQPSPTPPASGTMDGFFAAQGSTYVGEDGKTYQVPTSDLKAQVGRTQNLQQELSALKGSSITVEDARKFAEKAVLEDRGQRQPAPQPAVEPTDGYVDPAMELAQGVNQGLEGTNEKLQALETQLSEMQSNANIAEYDRLWEAGREKYPLATEDVMVRLIGEAKGTDAQKQANFDAMMSEAHDITLHRLEQPGYIPQNVIDKAVEARIEAAKLAPQAPPQGVPAAAEQPDYFKDGATTEALHAALQAEAGKLT